MYRFYLDTILVENPEGYDTFEEEIDRDDSLHGILAKQSTTLTFSGDGYAYLIGLFNSSGFCGEISLLVQKSTDEGNTFNDYFSGTIFVADIKFNLNSGTAECSVEDNSFSAMINNNKQVKTALSGSFSKNGIDIGECPYVSVEFFGNGTPFPSKGFRRIWDVEQVFRYLVRFMSDDRMDFQSNFLSSKFGADNTRPAISKAQSLRQNTIDAPVICFEDLLNEVYKKYNVFFVIEYGGAKPILRLEDEDFFFNTSAVVRLPDIPGMILSFTNERIYDSVKVGSKHAKYNVTYHSAYPLRYVFHRGEQYYFEGTCNTGNTLDLKSKWIIDTNVIQELVDTNTSNNDYDDDDEGIVFVNYYHTGGSPIVDYTTVTYGGSTFMYYNHDLTNQEVLKRFKLHNSVALSLGDGNDLSWATKTSDTLYSGTFPQTISPLPFEEETSDPNNNYSNVTYRYTAPAAGVYSFSTFVKNKLTILGSAGSFIIRIGTRKYNAANVLQGDSYADFYYVAEVNVDKWDYLNTGYFMDAGDYVVSYVTITIFSTTSEIEISHGSRFQCVSAQNSGGLFEDGSPEAVYLNKYEFEYPISDDQWNLIRNNLNRGIIINHDGVSNRTVFIRNLSRKWKDGMTRMEMINSANNN